MSDLEKLLTFMEYITPIFGMNQISKSRDKFVYLIHEICICPGAIAQKK